MSRSTAKPTEAPAMGLRVAGHAGLGSMARSPVRSILENSIDAHMRTASLFAIREPPEAPSFV